MNKCRRMAALQARAFADAGFTVLQPDLYGCGDSDGDFADATWARWVEDVLYASSWLRSESRGGPPILWAVRAGCLLASEAARRLDPPPDLLLWQPAVTGNQVLQQMLRLEVVGQMLDASRTARTGRGYLRERLTGGESVEIAGYSIRPELARGLESSKLEFGTRSRIGWIEVTSDPEPTLSPAARIRLDALGPGRDRVDARVVHGMPFWQTQEITECPALIDTTLNVVESWSP
jgi:exosortase A-associated hydrolase 2